MGFEQHIGYNAMGLSLEDKRSLLESAFAAKFNWWVDKLDCSESFARQKIDMSFEDVMRRLDDQTYVTVIHRMDRIAGEHMEIGFNTMESPADYFLWIQVPIELKDKFVEGLPRR